MDIYGFTSILRSHIRKWELKNGNMNFRIHIQKFIRKYPNCLRMIQI